jgi:hypothetical protein
MYEWRDEHICEDQRQEQIQEEGPDGTGCFD